MSAEADQIQRAPADTATAPTAVENVTTAVAKFDRVALGLAELKSKYAAVLFDVATTKGMKEALAARAAIRAPRVEVEKVRKECKAPILALGRDIDNRAAAITAELLTLEEPIDTQIKAEETRKEEEKQRKAEAERVRVAAIRDDIEQAFSCVPAAMVGQSAATIDESIRSVGAVELTRGRFAELLPSAEHAQLMSIEKLRRMRAAQVAHEAEQERLRLECEQFAQQRAEQEEANRIERERIATEAAEAKRKRDADEADALAKRQAEEAERQRQYDEAMASVRAEREQRAREEAQRAERQRSEDAQRAAAHRRQQDQLQREQELQAARWAEINAMGHQVTIAIAGRLGVREGGTRDCIIDTLAETGTWEVTEEKFGPLYGVAISARKTACDAITRELQAWDARVEAERIAVEAATAVVPAEPVAEPAEATEPEVAAILSTKAEPSPSAFAPTANDIAQLVSSQYGVTFDQALAWCVNAFFKE